MAEFLSILYLSAFAAVGNCVSAYVFHYERPIKRIWLGLVFEQCLLIWLPALFSFALGFALLSQLLALAAACALGVVFFRLAKKRERLSAPPVAELPILCVLVPLFLFSAILFCTHTIVPKNGGLSVGQSTFGDLAMHLGFISSIAVQGTFPPMYSICPDKLVGYPFLCESVGATFCVLGARLRFATLLTALYAMVLVLLGVYFFFEGWLKRKDKAICATLLFFIGGGFGFWYFFDVTKQNPENLTRLLTGFYETPTNLVGNGMRWVNPIADMLIPQRATLFGWSLLFPALYLLYRGAMERDRRVFLPLGLLAASMPLVHTHSFLALGIVSGYCFMRSLIKREDKRQIMGYLTYLGLVLLLAGPQLLIFTFPQSTGALKLHWNWANELDNYVWFYLKNFGLFALLLPVAFLDAKREDKAFYGGALLIWVIVECIQFQPNPYDNNKLLFISFAFTCALVANWLVDLYQKMLDLSVIRRSSVHVLSAICCILLFCSGVMTLMREYVSEYELIDADQNAAAEYIKANAAPDATFLTNNNHNNAVAALTGRNIVCGSGTFLYFHGVDYSAREQALPLMFEQPERYFQTLSKRFDVDYVYLGAYERWNYTCDEAWFDAHLGVFYQNGGVTIYDVNLAP